MSFLISIGPITVQGLVVIRRVAAWTRFPFASQINQLRRAAAVDTIQVVPSPCQRICVISAACTVFPLKRLGDDVLPVSGRERIRELRVRTIHNPVLPIFVHDSQIVLAASSAVPHFLRVDGAGQRTR